jgi:hypothetical protein
MVILALGGYGGTVRVSQLIIGFAVLIATSCSGHSAGPPQSTQGGCTNDQVKISLIKNDRFDVAFAQFRNTSARSCWLRGYPAITLLGAGQRPLPTHLVRSDSQAAQRVVLDADGGWAIASLSSPRAGVAGSCVRSEALRIGLPRTQASLAIENPRAYCKHGELEVSPIFYPSGGDLPLPSPSM